MEYSVSTLKTNTIQAATGTNITFSSLIKGEGTAGTTLNQGLAKAWVNFDGTASGAAARDGFNNASMTDGGTGIYTVTITKAMNSTNSMVVSALCTDDGAANNHVANISLLRTSGGSPFTTTTVGFNTVFETNAATLNDMDFVTVAIHGDLA